MHDRSKPSKLLHSKLIRTPPKPEVVKVQKKPRMLFVNDEGFVRIAHAIQFAPDFIFEEAENGL